MVRMSLSELTIHRNRNRNNFIDLLSADSLIPHIEIEGSIRSADIQELNDMFRIGPIYLMTKVEAEEYLELKRAEEVRKFKETAETKEENNDEECD